MLKFSAIAGAGIAAVLASATAADAHTAQEVRYLLRDRGFYNIDFLDTNPRHYQVNACRQGERFHVHVNFYGEVTEQAPIGPCHRRFGWWHRGY